MFTIDSYIGFPFSPSYVKSLLQEETADTAAPADAPICVRINSLGGSLQAALEIREQFLHSARPVHAHITGFTASAATILATGAARITMSPHALLLIHQCMLPAPEVLQDGLMNKDDIQAAISALLHSSDDLQQMDRLCASIYADRRPGVAPERMLQLMHSARWLTAEEALKEGLIDEIREDPQSAEPAPVARISARCVALGLPPLPDSAALDAAPAPPEPTLRENIIAAIRSIFHPNPNTNTPYTPMNQKPLLIPALAEIITSTPAALSDDTFSLPRADFQALNDAVLKLQTDLQAQAKELHAAQATLKDTQATLKDTEARLQDAQSQLAAADGDTTDAPLTPTAQADPSADLPGTEAARFFNEFQSII